MAERVSNWVLRWWPILACAAAVCWKGADLAIASNLVTQYVGRVEYDLRHAAIQSEIARNKSVQDDLVKALSDLKIGQIRIETLILQHMKEKP
jgi:hypothetical protein